MSVNADVVIVGAGLAGLAAGIELQRAGRDVIVLEASDGPGGRVRTDVVDGYRLDRGFQILLTAYPEARRLLDFETLDLRHLRPGAMVRIDDGFARIGDPLRRPADLVATLAAPVGSIVDKLKVLQFRRSVSRGSLDDLWSLFHVAQIESCVRIFSKHFTVCFTGRCFEIRKVPASELHSDRAAVRYFSRACNRFRNIFKP